MIPVTKAYLPNKDNYQDYVEGIFRRGWLTNNGRLVKELENRLQNYLGVKHLIVVANGTLALQLAYKALELKGEVITTPFSFVATTSSLVWEGLKPVFVDIDPATFNIDSTKITAKISKNTSALVPVHVFGNPCEVEQIQDIAQQHNLKVIYDGAHAFDTQYKGESVLSYGDISTLSFHATKLFHSTEGGAIITNDDELAGKIRLMMNFGIASATQINAMGINAKMNEFEAAMGLCVLDEIELIKDSRAKVWRLYQQALTQKTLSFQRWHKNSNNNHAYAPILFNSEAELLRVEAKLKKNHIFPRRYFYPSLDTLDYLDDKQVCKHSRDIASRILCLPLFTGLTKQQQDKIIVCIKS
ncbi:DegT/DnrJ/EryC1/StrS family aminotransferase [Psychrobacter sp. 1Y11]|uniref:DegT/DnrJ/EryC1/StrS family aminotransferase n=1 Tax=Psychrobacter sp. 1Y11 TaxID=3457446 RepID=UPI003FD3C3F7